MQKGVGGGDGSEPEKAIEAYKIWSENVFLIYHVTDIWEIYISERRVTEWRSGAGGGEREITSSELS